MNRLTKDLKTPHNDTTYSDVVINCVDRENIVLTKLKMYEDLEQQLGCPLEVVFKALKDGIILSNNELYDCHLSYSETSKDFIFICYERESHEAVVGVSIEQHKLTWWLKGEKPNE